MFFLTSNLSKTKTKRSKEKKKEKRKEKEKVWVLNKKTDLNFDLQPDGVVWVRVKTEIA